MLAEIDLRFGSKEQGSLQVVVAPVMRFMDNPPENGVKIEVSMLGRDTLMPMHLRLEKLGTGTLKSCCCWVHSRPGLRSIGLRALQDIGQPQKIIEGFHSEIFGAPLIVSLQSWSTVLLHGCKSS